MKPLGLDSILLTMLSGSRNLHVAVEDARGRQRDVVADRREADARDVDLFRAGHVGLQEQLVGGDVDDVADD